MYIPFLSSTLPSAASGPYGVGYAVVRAAPVEGYSDPDVAWRDDKPGPQSGTATPNSTDSGTTITPTSPLRMAESAYALYYPADKVDGSATVPWTPLPQEAALEGYRKFLSINGGFGGIAFWFIGKLLSRIQFPATPLAPLASSQDGKPFPLVVYSHGLCGTRNTYSQFCSALASEGYVVLAVEHADGSAPAVVRPGGPQVFTRSDEIVFSDKDDAPFDDPRVKVNNHKLMRWRTRQLDFRVREVYDAYHSFSALLNGTEGSVDDLPAESAASFLSTLGKNVDTTDVQLTGHSFGGGTLVRLLSTSPQAWGYDPIPAKRAVLLDPWIEPLLLAAPCAPTSIPPPPTLTINSQGWTEEYWHPEMVKVCRGLGAGMCTILGLAHQGFSDMGLIKSAGAGGYLRTTHELTMAQLTDSLGSSSLFAGVADGGETKFVNGKMEGKKGGVVVHLKPKTE